MQATPLFIAKESGCLFAGFDGSPSLEKQRIMLQAPRFIQRLLPI